jgi:hypothetical protein
MIRPPAVVPPGFMNESSIFADRTKCPCNTTMIAAGTFPPGFCRLIVIIGDRNPVLGRPARHFMSAELF